MALLNIDHDNADVLTADGTVVHLRDLGPADLDALERLHDRASDRSIYLRFFSTSRPNAKRYAVKLAQAADGDHHAIGAFRHDEVVAVGVFERLDAESAEFALLVVDSVQHDGIGTLLLEHLVALARSVGIRRFVGEVLSENAGMIKVIRRLGFPVATSMEDGSLHVEVAIDSVTPAVSAIEGREQSGRRREPAPPAGAPLGGRCRRRAPGRHRRPRGTAQPARVRLHRRPVRGQPAPPRDPRDPGSGLAARPPGGRRPGRSWPSLRAQVPTVLRECGQRGCRTAVIVGAGFGEAGASGVQLQDEALAAARRYGMRLVGPNCIGLINTAPDVRLDATFGSLRLVPGHLAVLAQSGAFGVGLLAAAADQGLGVSQFVSVGNKADVGGNDLLLAWAEDPQTQVIAMYLESVGDPRRFARIARRVAVTKPIIAIKSGRTAAGRRAGQSHTAAAASPDAAVDALFTGSGVLRLNTMAELLDAARVLTTQPLPAGPRIAIVGNSGGPEILAADAAAEAGLVVAEFGAATREALVQAGASGQNPIDLGAAAQPDTVAAVLQAVQASPDVDAVLTVFTEIAVTDGAAIRSAVIAAAAASGKPTVAVEVGGAPRPSPSRGPTRSLPIFTFPEGAAAALGVAHRYAGIHDQPIELPVRPAGVDPMTARALVTAALSAGGGWLAPDQVDVLLSCYGIPRCPQRIVHSGDDAVQARGTSSATPSRSSWPGPDCTRPTSAASGSASTTPSTCARPPASCSASTASPGCSSSRWCRSGVELIAGGIHDAQFGPLVMLGAGGVLTDVLEDRTLRLAPDHHDCRRADDR